MMRTIWNAFAFVAVVNLLALVLAAGWMWQTGRLDRARVEAVRAIFAIPIAEEEAARVAEAQADADAVAAEEAEVAWTAVPVTNLDAADAMERFRDLGRQTNERLAGDADLLVDRIEETYRARSAELARMRAGIERDFARLEEMRTRSEDADFKQVIEDLGEQKLEVAFSIVRVWLGEGRRTLVVDVLHALDADRRNAILGEFVDVGRDEVAADLQLALRDRTAVEAAGAETADANAPDSSLRSGPDPEPLPLPQTPSPYNNKLSHENKTSIAVPALPVIRRPLGHTRVRLSVQSVQSLFLSVLRVWGPRPGYETP